MQKLVVSHDGEESYTRISESRQRWLKEIHYIAERLKDHDDVSQQLYDAIDQFSKRISTNGKYACQRREQPDGGGDRDTPDSQPQEGVEVTAGSRDGVGTKTESSPGSNGGAGGSSGAPLHGRDRDSVGNPF